MASRPFYLCPLLRDQSIGAGTHEIGWWLRAHGSQSLRPCSSSRLLMGAPRAVQFGFHAGFLFCSRLASFPVLCPAELTKPGAESRAGALTGDILVKSRPPGRFWARRRRRR
eukprot:2596906-Pyramimonas_sp.AAC.1